jgi:hypothetical protein
MKDSFWARRRRDWHMALRGLTREAAEDLIHGLNLGELDVHLPPIVFRRLRSRHYGTVAEHPAPRAEGTFK